MTATITANNGAGSTVPHFVIAPYETAQESRNVVHSLIGGGLAISLVPAMPRTGDLELLYLSEAEAFACAALHEQATTLTLTESDRPHLNMTYVLSGSVRVRLESDASTWVVVVRYQEED